MSIIQLLSTPLASLITGMLCMVLLLATKKHRDDDGKIASPKIASAFLFGIALHVTLICIVGQFYLAIPISETINTYGNERVAWLFVGLAADLFARLYRLYDP